MAGDVPAPSCPTASTPVARLPEKSVLPVNVRLAETPVPVIDWNDVPPGPATRRRGAARAGGWVAIWPVVRSSQLAARLQLPLTGAAQASWSVPVWAAAPAAALGRDLDDLGAARPVGRLQEAVGAEIAGQV